MVGKEKRQCVRKMSGGLGPGEGPSPHSLFPRSCFHFPEYLGASWNRLMFSCGEVKHTTGFINRVDMVTCPPFTRNFFTVVNFPFKYPGNLLNKPTVSANQTSTNRPQMFKSSLSLTSIKQRPVFQNFPLKVASTT